MLAGAACTSVEPVEQTRRPNLLVLMADDLGYSDIGPYGGEIETPSLDRLADAGIRFMEFYNTGRCWPTRASLLTGMYPHQAGLGGGISSVNEPLPARGPFQGYLDPDTPTIAERLRDGFDRYFGLISGASSYFEIIADQPRVRQMALDDDPWKPPAQGFYMTDAITDHAVRFIEEHASTDDTAPFFLYVPYTAPHWPLHALPDEIAKYRGRYDEGWDGLRQQRHGRMLELGLIDARHALATRPPSMPAFADVDTADWAVRMSVYAAMVDRMDQGIGRIVAALTAAGLLDDTLILFLADNGASAENIEARNLHDPSVPIGERGSYAAYREPWAVASNTPYRRYRSWMYEGGIKSPLIAHWPGGLEEPGRFSNRPGHVIDVMATALELAGIDTPADDSIALSEGQSFLGVITGSTVRDHDALYWEHLGHRAIRKDGWKAVFTPLTERWELFRLDDDPTEIDDVGNEHPDRLAELIATWTAWAARVGAGR